MVFFFYKKKKRGGEKITTITSGVYFLFRLNKYSHGAGYKRLHGIYPAEKKRGGGYYLGGRFCVVTNSQGTSGRYLNEAVQLHGRRGGTPVSNPAPEP